ncbi:molybdopterin synthase catalytic subunit MoaE [Pseudomaricurvus alkylphenolicus]|jgi:molybdopterin synthase catalytic subunit|uniref:molybdopterin synthase catalytic subunit MoaE n=1 Tax=Pseudomaricurvus alkylphenolicus TaxID=1306991 RepID=UPI0014248501|nr:molybdopterin synthase catalytic subunit MoaE [Pseudomaricurvus alkylphenolicus]NIB42049.1 molybdopterin synthase catalytic subunit MoaE [Pseudomaricurvus alkylphenolicus]
MIIVQEQDFDLQAEYSALREDSPAIGAIVTFTGLMRDFNQGDDVQSLFLEHYAGMTEKVLEKICAQARDRWSIQQIRLIHRVGELRPSDQIVFVGVSSAHRGDAFAACEFIMDFLKTQAPFWKREQTRDGDRWVDARQSDADAARRWQKD